MTRTVIASIALCSSFFLPTAQADELMNACIRVVEAEGQAEGIAGCQCLVDEVGNDKKMTKALLALAEQEAEDRILTRGVSKVVGKCFALPEDENEQA